MTATPQTDHGSSFTVVFIEDDERLAKLTTSYLVAHDVIVHREGDGIAGLKAALSIRPDVVLLDVMLPGVDGIEVCKRIRSQSSVPIVMLTARDNEQDRVHGLESGADDYVLKPFSSPELLARLRAQVRRARGQLGPTSDLVSVGNLEIDPSSRIAKLNARELILTTYEFSLLHTLAQNAGRVLTREQLIDRIRGSAEEAFDRSVDVHVSHLRHKLGDDPRNPRMLKTVRGVGYTLVRQT